MQPALRDLVLVGGGHAHVGVLRRFAMQPEPGLRITLVSLSADTPYSGMLPGHVAGHYSWDEVHIDLDRLCVFAGARFVRAEVLGLDRSARRVRLSGRPDLAYDRVSINIGSTPQLQGTPGAREYAIGVKPIHDFNERWRSLLQRVRTHSGALRVAVVGAGAGGVELLLAMQWRLRAERRAQAQDPDSLHFALYSADPVILPTHSGSVRRHFEDTLRARGVEVHTGQRVLAVEAGRLLCDGQWREHDEIVWVTQAGGAEWLGDTGLELDDRGFILVNACLQSVSDSQVFAAGDVASMTGRPLEKAGVFAVRMGRPLADNLRRSLRGEALRPYRPQRHWLSLISTGDRHAVASWGPFGVSGEWVWRWKDRIDRRFMRRFSPFDSSPDRMAVSLGDSGHRLELGPDESAQALSLLAMRCGGCGAKVGASVLSRVLARLRPFVRDDVVLGLDAPDDAAVLRVPPGQLLVQTVDFFRAFIEDPYVFGRIAANHALSDIFAMGARVQSAQALLTVPAGLDTQIEELLVQLMSGALSVLNESGCALVGGHTAEGSELAMGFAVNGLIDESMQGLMRRSGLRPGDALVLTKPLGTGTLLVARAALRARGRWISAALESMQVSNRQAARCLVEHGAGACTDVTGFGLLGHLVEMTRASGVDAELWLGDLPLLPGALESASAGWLSSLQPGNLRLRTALVDHDAYAGDPRFALLFDPQTSGGLLAGVPADQASACVQALRVRGYAGATIIGQVRDRDDSKAPVTLTTSVAPPTP